MKSQNKQILAYLKRGKSLTAIQALEMFGCFRLAARIHDLNEQGHDIKTIMHYVKGKKWAEYIMEAKA